MKCWWMLILLVLVLVDAATHKYSAADLGPIGPFVDENGQCSLDPCEALGRARDELVVALNEKDKVQVATGTLLGELKSAVSESQETQFYIQEFMKQIDRRLRSLEQPSNYHFYILIHFSITQVAPYKTYEFKCLECHRQCNGGLYTYAFNSLVIGEGSFAMEPLLRGSVYVHR